MCVHVRACVCMCVHACVWQCACAYVFIAIHIVPTTNATNKFSVFRLKKMPERQIRLC